MCLVWARAVLSWIVDCITSQAPHTLNSTSMSKAYQSTFTGETNTPYSKQFVHSSHLSTGGCAQVEEQCLPGSLRIQGLGLYAAKDLEKHTMVIEVHWHHHSQ